MEALPIELWPEGAPFAQGSGEEDRPAITPYLVEGSEPTAAVIVCPGGGYARRAAHEGEPIAQWLNTLGISAFVLRYRVAPYRHEATLGDAQRAIRYVRSRAKEWNIDAGRVGILGFSAGGHLASSAGTHYDSGQAESEDPVERESCRPNLMVLCYPVISFGEYRHEGSLTNFLGEEPSEELVRLFSNELQVTADTPPTFLWHTGDDASVPVENSLLLAAALSKHNVPFELHSYTSGRHGLGLAQTHPEAQTWPDLCARWLRRFEFAQPVPIELQE
ncbi:alpha/beta hydrolase [Paenibacillus turpanensis]|uniref:alpha/beta hydrolase n=1 Tax=Paenibacillus turpanensis TaxID=2689078 RepID=UPI001A9D08BB|nr:alpha/beta hydrolase [Paenibacillus turpanensis]